VHVPLTAPSITECEVAYVVDVLRSRWITSGPAVDAFERGLARYLHAPAVMATSSCTDAIEIALRVLDVTGKAVFYPTIGFPGIIHAIVRAGGRPVLVDVDPDDGTMSPEHLAACVASAPDPGAIIPVHLGGLPADMAAIDAIAGPDIAVVEDAAHCPPAVVAGRTIGDPSSDWGGPLMRLTAFSFHATKTLTCAEGGALAGPTAIIEAALPWRLHGMSRDAWARAHDQTCPDWLYDVVAPGLKANLSDVHAAIGLCQLDRADELHERRRTIATRYDRALHRIDGLSPPPRRPGRSSAHYAYQALLADGDRDRVLSALRDQGVQGSVYFTPIHHLSAFANLDGAFPGAERFYARAVALPCAASLVDAQVAHVIESLRRTLA
jgi:dTDP-4-amino-4,6-dideoxygalactose transaminase